MVGLQRDCSDPANSVPPNALLLLGSPPMMKMDRLQLLFPVLNRIMQGGHHIDLSRPGGRPVGMRLVHSESGLAQLRSASDCLERSGCVISSGGNFEWGFIVAALLDNAGSFAYRNDWLASLSNTPYIPTCLEGLKDARAGENCETPVAVEIITYASSRFLQVMDRSSKAAISFLSEIRSWCNPCPI